MDREKFDKIIKEREYWAQFQEAGPETMDRIWEDLTELLSEDINDTIEFMKNEINESDFFWIIEVFDDIAEKTQSKEFIKALYDVAKKFPKVTKEYNVIERIEFANDYIY